MQEENIVSIWIERRASQCVLPQRCHSCCLEGGSCAQKFLRVDCSQTTAAHTIGMPYGVVLGDAANSSPMLTRGATGLAPACVSELYSRVTCAISSRASSAAYDPTELLRLALVQAAAGTARVSGYAAGVYVERSRQMEVVGWWWTDSRALGRCQ